MLETAGVVEGMAKNAQGKPGLEGPREEGVADEGGEGVLAREGNDPTVPRTTDDGDVLCACTLRCFHGFRGKRSRSHDDNTLSHQVGAGNKGVLTVVAAGIGHDALERVKILHTTLFSGPLSGEDTTTNAEKPGNEVAFGIGGEIANDGAVVAALVFKHAHGFVFEQGVCRNAVILGVLVQFNQNLCFQSFIHGLGWGLGNSQKGGIRMNKQPKTDKYVHRARYSWSGGLGSTGN